MQVQDLFNVKYGVNLEYCNMTPDDAGIPFISRQSKNNGMVSRVRQIKGKTPNPANTISVSCGGSVMESFLQVEPYYSGRDILFLRPKQKLNRNQLLFYCMILRSNAYRYNYGRQANATLRTLSIPDFKELPSWVNETRVKKPSTKPKHNVDLSLEDREWHWFSLNDYFTVRGSKRFTSRKIAKHGKGEYPFITRSSENNGAQSFHNHWTEEGNVLTVDSTTVGSCFYQARKFTASDHVEKLIPKFKMNVYSALFIKTIIEREKFRYGYGRGYAQVRLKETKIKLPADKESEPDWDFMEDYIKMLPYSSNL